MSDNTPLGDRMKRYERSTRSLLPRRTYTIVRVDGKAFHGLLNHADRPYDFAFITAMRQTAAALCNALDGVAFAYTQSDEISLLLTDFVTTSTEPWFGGVVQKIASVAAATASVLFGAQPAIARRPWWLEQPEPRVAVFDGRVFTIPDPVEAGNYFIWRQRDSLRNSVLMAAQAKFSHRQLLGLNTLQMQEKLYSEAGVNWSNYPVAAKRGSIAIRQEYEDDTMPGVTRHRWVADDAPDFKITAGTFLAQHIPPLPTMPAAFTDQPVSVGL